MFHMKLGAPRVRGLSGLYRGAYGTFQLSPPGSLLAAQIKAAASAIGLSVNAGAGTVTAIRANNSDGATTVEFLASSVTGGDAQYRAVTLGVSNWSFGNRRSDGAFVIANATNLATANLSIATNGRVTINTVDNGNSLIANDTSGTITDGIVAVTTQHAGVTKGWLGTGLATGLGALNDFGLVVFAGELSAGQNGTSTAAGELPITYWMRLNSNYTLTSQTAAQKAFNIPSNGALTLPVGTYEFECFLPLSSMSATSGSFGFALGGTATIVSWWWSIASKLGTAAATPEAVQWTYNLAANANTALATASTALTGFALCRGVFTVQIAGTVIPEVSLGVAAAAVVASGAYFFCRYMSISNSRTTFGPIT